ncbi:hypothetical protein LZ198_39905 [Myxococcus sp. K15C18031901]|uniref:hypothetical protein n=1 Tax=Myxococcus dinghuensis TaxID=2906761 RepID=UPI0020A7A405|nr:hypothetical protein [Myxococcus dinghuensis]MCP3105049.1 hypothetical protein [Myxococcus dinghuensis]
MKRHAWTLGLVLALGCGKDSPPTNPGADGGSDGGSEEQTPFTKLEVDADPSEFNPISNIAMAVGPNDRIGMVYFVNNGTMTGSVANYDLRYREFDGGTLGPVEKIVTVQRVYGVSLAFGPDGQPAVAYLGGGRDDSTFWLQSDLAVSYRNANGTWTERIVATRSNAALTNNPLSDAGFLVGLNPSIIFSGNQALVAYRDGHNGNFGRQDWESADLELAIGGPTAWTFNMVAPSGDTKEGFGGHISLIQAGAQPAVVHDRAFESAQATGADVVFQRRNANGTTWSAPTKVQVLANGQLGPSMAYDAEAGFGIAVLSKSDDKLTYIECADRSATSCTAAADWTSPDPVYHHGTGGWYPSLAFDPVNHDPSIAYYICAEAAGRNDTSCNPNEDKLVVATRIGGIWRETLVDANGGWSPKLAYLSSGKRVVLYRTPVVSPTKKGVLHLAVER